MKFTILILVFFSLCAEATALLPQHRRIRLKHIENKGVGYDTGYTTLELFLSPDPEARDIIPFVDARGHLFDNGRWAANGGIGLRSLQGKRIYGMNAYYDYRGTSHLNYSQVSLGLEMLGRRVDGRINGYLPIGKKTSSPYDTKYGYFSGHSLFLSQKVEFAMKGFDAEVGFRLGNCAGWNFYAATGPYYFRGPDGPNAWGGKVRADVSYRDWLTLEIIESYDSVFHNNIQGQIGFSFPLGKKTIEKRVKKSACRMVQPIIRNEIIVLSHKRIHPLAINPLTHAPYYFVFVNNTSSSEGTFESPYPSLLLAQEHSSANDIIYLFPGNGTTTNMDQGIVLKPSQKLWGSAIFHNLQTEQGQVTIPQMSSIAPQVTNVNLLGDGATLSTYNEISGITFTQTSGHAIFGTDPVETSLSFCSFLSCGQGDAGLFPVVIQASSPVIATIENNYFISNPNAGAFFKLLPGVSFCSIAMNNNQAYHNQASSGGGALLNIEAHGSIGVCEMVMNSNIYQNNDCYCCNITDFDTPQEGTFSSFQGTINGNIFTGNTQGINFATNADLFSMTIQNNNLSNNRNGSIYISNGLMGAQVINKGSIVIDSNFINEGGVGGDAITISPAGNSLSIAITNNSISNNLGTGYVSYFNLPGPNLVLTISDNVITNNQNMFTNISSGISCDRFSSITATIEGNTLSNNTGASYSNSIGSGTNFPATSTVIFAHNQLSENETFDFEFDGSSPNTGCLTITGNTSTSNPTYNFTQLGTGACFIVPCNYDTVNTGGFTLTGITPSSNCSGTSCP